MGQFINPMKANVPLVLLLYVEYFQEANLAYSSKKEQAELLQKVRHTLNSDNFVLKSFINKRPGYKATALTAGRVTVPLVCVQVLAASDADADEEGVAPMASKPQVHHPPYSHFIFPHSSFILLPPSSLLPLLLPPSFLFSFLFSYSPPSFPLPLPLTLSSCYLSKQVG